MFNKKQICSVHFLEHSSTDQDEILHGVEAIKPEHSDTALE